MLYLYFHLDQCHFHNQYVLCKYKKIHPNFYQQDTSNFQYNYYICKHNILQIVRKTNKPTLYLLAQKKLLSMLYQSMYYHYPQNNINSYHLFRINFEVHMRHSRYHLNSKFLNLEDLL